MPLNDVGERQAKRLAEFVRGLSARPTSIIASPKLRARRTAEILAEALDLEIEFDARFIERSFGLWEGKAYQEIMGSWRGEGSAWNARPPGGESPADVVERVWPALEDVATRKGTPVVVAHGGVIGALVCRILGMPFEQANVNKLGRDNTGITIVKRRQKLGGAFAVATLNATFHLDGLTA